MTRYFRLIDDMSAVERWYLEGPTGPGGAWLGAALSRGMPYAGPVPVECRVHHSGRELELTLTEDTVPIVNQRVATILQREAERDIQLIPATVQGSGSALWAVNILAAPDCIDESRSAEVRRFTAEDALPDRVGEYSQIGGLRIDPSRAEGHAILRPRWWWVAVIVSAPLEGALRREQVRCELQAVT
jgi:hypothetical protein